MDVRREIPSQHNQDVHNKSLKPLTSTSTAFFQILEIAILYYLHIKHSEYFSSEWNTLHTISVQEKKKN